MEEQQLSSQELADKIEQEAEDSLFETLWGKPANDILTGINNNSQIKPDRAIWEMVQNARDVSKPHHPSNISFTRNADTFEFKHDGLPFERKTIQALILQTSSKVRNDIVQIGKYGTGFLTTHKLGLKFRVQGCLSLLGGKIYYNFRDGILLNRSYTDKLSLIKELNEKIEETKNWGKNQSELEDKPDDDTVFTYIQENAVEKKNSEEVFRSSPRLVPYVLALNKNIGSISFHDNIDNRNFSYARSDRETIEESADFVLSRVDIAYSSKEGERKIGLFLLDSKSCNAEVSESEVTIILPIVENEEGKKIVTQELINMPQIYLYLPLLGTANWGLNFIIHSPAFSCDTDSRDSLLLVGNGQTNDKVSEENRRLLALAFDIIKKYITSHYQEFADFKYLAKVNFKRGQANEELAEYYNSLQKAWVKFFSSLSLVKIQGVCETEDKYVKPSDICVLDKELCEACVADNNLLDAVYELLRVNTNNIVPAKAELLYWSKILWEWYDDDKNAQFKGATDIANIIESLQTLNADNSDAVHTVCAYFSTHNHFDLFDQAILPNEVLSLHKLSDLVRPIINNATLRKALSTLCPREVDSFIHPQYIDIVGNSLSAYGTKEVKEVITHYTSEANNNNPKGALKTQVLANQYVKIQNFQSKLLPSPCVRALMDIYNMLVQDETNGFANVIFGLLKEYYNYSPESDVKMTKDEFDVRNCYNTLLNDALLGFSLLTDEEKAQKEEWCLRMVKELYSFKEANSLLYNFSVYPNQMGEYMYAEQLKKENNLPLRLKELYDIIINKNDKEKSIKHQLVSSEFSQYFIDSGVLEGKDLSSKIEEPFNNGSISIANNSLQQYYIEIIQKLDESENGQVWKTLFPNINSIKANLMLSVINSPKKRNSIFTIMKVEDEENLQKLAKLTQNPDFAYLLDKALQLVEKEKRDNKDLEFKKALGEYVERFIQDSLNNVLENNILTVSIPVINEQGGQDLIVYLNGQPIYYIEVKSRWSTDKSVLMSTLQHLTSCEQQEHYALCVVDMSGFNNDKVKNDEMPQFADILNRTVILENIGKLNSRLKPATDDMEGMVHVANGYQVLVPQTVIRNNAIYFDEFINHLENMIKNLISNS